MEVKNKLRIMSQEHRNQHQKAYKNDRNMPRTLKKIASLNPQSSSPTRAIQKLGKAAHSEYREALQSHERRRDSNQKQTAEFSEQKNNFMRKVSEDNLRSLGHLVQKNELNNYKSSLHVLANSQYSQKIKLQKLKKSKDIERIYFTKGNNQKLLKELFVDKYGFNETSVRQNATICWLQSSSQKDNSKIISKSIHQDHLPDIKRRKGETKVVYNYLEGQSQLTNKQRLYKNMSKAYPIAIGTYIPKSFIIDFRLDQTQIQQSLLQFIAYYFKKEKNKRPRNKSIVIKNYYADITVSHKQLNKLIQKSQSLEADEHQKSTQQQKVENNDNLWILKPTYLNRGRGIHLFATLKQLSKLLSQTPFEISIKMYSDNTKPITYIIQEYIDRPLLIDGYKFDMRFWVMLQVVKIQGKKVLKAYLFKQGYVRLASVKYEVMHEKQEQILKQDSKEQKQNHKREKKAYINNKYIHLTNNAVQKDAKQYGHFCEGNQLSLQKMLQYFQQKNKSCPLDLQQLQQNVAKIVRESVKCVKDKLIELNHTKTFQLLGYDFLLDQHFRMWLIQANCNPCLEQSSVVVAHLLRKMLSGLINLTNLSERKGPNQSSGWVELY